MKKKEILEQLNQMETSELKEQADSLKESLFRLKFKKSLGVGDSVNDIRREKKTLAQVRTLINQREPKIKGKRAKAAKQI
ncbi:MAG: 50S ribosomal protein L29 [Pyrinomonadaceae bacterium]|nr:50S ribosomal protein L29 [Pyrinomonadaceae bacterium]